MISEKIKEIREKNNLNKRQISQMLKIPYTTYNNYETGYREPGSDFLIKFSHTFGVSIDYLMGNDVEYQDFIKQYKKEDAITDIFKRLKEDTTFYEAVQKLYVLDNQKLKGVISMLSSFEQD